MKKLTKHRVHPVGLILIPFALMIIAAPVFESTVSAQTPATTPGWTYTGSLNAYREGHTATLLANGKVLVAGGSGGGGVPNSSAEIYDPSTGTWSLTGSLIQRRSNHSATLLQNGQVLVAGGFDYGSDIGGFAYVNSAELYDPATGNWLATGSLGGFDNAHNSMTLLSNGKVLSVGPEQDYEGYFYGAAQLYNPSTGTWESSDSPSIPGLTLSLPNGKVVITDGHSAELYDPLTRQWTRAGTSPGLLNFYTLATATLLDNGKILVIGSAFPAASMIATLYDPATETWTRTGDLKTVGGWNTTLLPGGKVLVTGGRICTNGQCTSFNSSELYDPSTGNWSLTSNLNTAHSGHTATLLAGGRVLVAGGNDERIGDIPGKPPSGAELYAAARSSTSIDDASFFVRQQYRDFLNREADGPGLDFWTMNITRCGDPARRLVSQTESECIDKQQVNTSAAFFLSPEFQYTGYFVYRLYKGSLIKNGAGRVPTYQEFLRDVRQVASGIIQNNQLSATAIEQNKKTFGEIFVQRPEFRSLYDPLSNFDYVERLFQTTGINVSAQEKQALVAGLNNQTETRAAVLQKVVDGTVVFAEGNQQFTTTYGKAFYEKEFNAAFVQMEYFGYLQRDPDAAGYQHWLDKLNFYGNYIDAEMVKSFIASPEYRARFDQP